MSASFPQVLDVFRRHRKTRVLRNPTRRPRPDARGGISLHREQLEQRLALAVDIYTPLAKTAGAAPWTVLGSSSGSDVYIQQVATVPQDLIVADNPSFNAYKSIPNISGLQTVAVTQAEPTVVTGIERIGLGSELTTTHVLSHGGVFGNTIGNGVISYNGQQWTFAAAPVLNILVTNGGSGYLVPPNVFINPTGGNGAGAMATANLTGGKVTSITVVNTGGGYITTPNITISGGGGTGATGLAVVGPAGIQITSGPSFGTYPLGVTLATAGQEENSINNNGPFTAGVLEFTWAQAPLCNAGVSPSVDTVSYLYRPYWNRTGDTPIDVTDTTILPSAGSSASFRLPSGRQAVGIAWGTLEGSVTLDGAGDIPATIRFRVQSLSPGFGTTRIPLVFETGATNATVGIDGGTAPRNRRLTGFVDTATNEVALNFEANNGTIIPVDPGRVTLSASYGYINQSPAPVSFTLAPGQTFSRDFVLDLQTPGSTANFNSPLVQTSGSMLLSASNINFNAQTTISNRMDIRASQFSQQPASPATALAEILAGSVVAVGVPQGLGGSGYSSAPAVTFSGGGGSGAAGIATIQAGTVVGVTITNPGSGYTSRPLVTIAPPGAGATLAAPTPERLSFNAAVSASTYDIRIGDDLGTPGVNRGQLFVSPSGSLAGSGSVYVQADTSDIVVEGTINSANQTYLMRSPVTAQDRAPFVFTTKSPTTGADTGLITATNLAITLANDLVTPDGGGAASNSLSLRTAVTSLRITAANRGGQTAAFPYDVSIDELNDISIDAVPASSGRIGIKAGGGITFNSALATDGDIDIEAGGNFTVSAPLSTTRGQIEISAKNLTVSNSLRVLDPVVDPTVDDLVLTATGGTLNLTGAISAVNNVRLVQNGGGGKIFGPSRVIGRGVTIDADGSVDVRTGTDFLQGRAGGSFAVDELDDITIPALRAGGFVTLRAAGIDPGLGNIVSPNAIALTATLQDVSGLEVSAPRGSILVTTNTEKTLALGNPATIAAGTAQKMEAAGSVLVRSIAGPLDIADAPIGGAGGVPVRVATSSPLPAATFAYNNPGVIASTLTATSVGPLVVDGITVRVGDRVLVRNQTNARENGVYDVTVAGSFGPPGRAWVLTRAIDVDTTTELPGNSMVRVAEGSAAGRVFQIGYTQSFGTSPLIAVPVANRSGATRVRVATTDPLPGAYDPAAGTITGTGALPAIDGVTLAVGNRVLVRLGAQAMPAGLQSSVANGVYQVTSVGGGAGSWVLTRAIDVDTGLPIRIGYVAVAEGTFRSATTGQGFRLFHDSLGVDPMVVTPVATTSGRPTTNIGSDDISDVATFIVSSSAGTNDSAGSLGKMIRLRQQNDTSASRNPLQKNDFRFSALIAAPIELSQELPVVVQPLPIDATAANRYRPVGAPANPAPIVVDGTSITLTNVETGVFRGTGTATITGPAELTVPGSFPNFEELRPGMTVQGAGIRPGARISAIDSATRKVTLNSPNPIVFDVGTSLAVTFATEVNGFQFAPGATGGRLAGLFVGGFESGTAVWVTAPLGAPATPGGTPTTVAIESVSIGRSPAGNRLGNEFGVVVAGTGAARISGGAIVSSEGAGVRTQDAAGVVIAGTTIGASGAPNVTGVDVSGSGAVEIGALSTDPTTVAPRTTIAFNRNGVVLQTGTTRIVNTTIADNSFDGVQIDGGNYQIGASTTRGDTSNAIVRNGEWAIDVAAGAAPTNPQADGRRIQGNFLGVNPDGTAAVNTLGTVNVVDAMTTARLGLRPRPSGIDVHANLHAAMPVRPTAFVEVPLDNSGLDVLGDVDNRVQVDGQAAQLTRLVLGLEDDGNEIDAATVVASAFTVRYSPSLAVADWGATGIETWVAGTNYAFAYDAATRQVSFTVAAGLPAGSYRISVDNSATTGVRDLDDNPLLANDLAGPGTTAFDVILNPVGGGPVPPPVPGDTLIIGDLSNMTPFTVQATREDTRHILIQNGGDIIIVGLIEATQAGRRITVNSAGGGVSFQSAGELRASGVVLTARDHSQLRIGPAVKIESATVSNGALAVTAAGAVQQTGAITATSLSVSAIGGAIDLANAANAVDFFSASAPLTGGNVTFVNSRGFTVNGAGVTAGTGAALDGRISLTAQAGNLTVAAPLSAPQDVAFLRAPAGTVTVNAGVTNNVRPLIRQDSAGTVVDGGFLVGDAAGMNSAVQLINTLPAGPVYEIVVAASFMLDRTLSFTNAVDLQGMTSGIVLSGSTAAPDGVVFTPTAGGSRVTNLAFSGFTGTAVTIDRTPNMVIRGLTVTNAGTGMALSGDVTGTTVQGSTFRSTDVAVRLTDAKGATLGGNDVADRIRIEGARRAGIFATGLNTSTKVIRPTFTSSPGTRVRFNIRSSRNLRVIGTIVERTPVARPTSGSTRPPFSLFGR